MLKRILLVDDDANSTKLLRLLLERAGYCVREENDSASALRHAREFQPDFVLLDYTMPVVDGGDVAWHMAADANLRNTKLIVCSGAPLAEINFHMPPNRIPVLEKPVDIDVLLKLLSEI